MRRRTYNNNRNYIELLDGTVIPLLNTQDVSALRNNGFITIRSITFPSSDVSKVIIPDLSLFLNSRIYETWCRLCTNLTELVLPDGIVSIGEWFLQGCTSFNGPINLSGDLVSIGSNFLYNCISFNQPLILPDGLASIGSSFLLGCTSFNQPLTLPDSLTSVGYQFLFTASAFTGILDIGSLSADVFSSDHTNTILSGTSNTAPAYVQGIRVAGDNVADFLAKYPNSTRSLYRNLLPA